MESKVTIDKFGRVVIPAQMRRKLGIKAGSELIIELRGSMIIIRPVRDIDRIVDQWFEKLMNTKIKAKFFRVGGGKWMGDDYVRRKLGLD